MNSKANVKQESAETVYMRQHATIAAAIDMLQKTLDDMQAPDESAAPILWGDVAEFAQAAEAAANLINWLGHNDS